MRFSKNQIIFVINKDYFLKQVQWLASVIFVFSIVCIVLVFSIFKYDQHLQTLEQCFSTGARGTQAFLKLSLTIQTSLSLNSW
jgi:hypothetical protein